jgi:hypothetical protein
MGDCWLTAGADLAEAARIVQRYSGRACEDQRPPSAHAIEWSRSHAGCVVLLAATGVL